MVTLSSKIRKHEGGRIVGRDQGLSGGDSTSGGSGSSDGWTMEQEERLTSEWVKVDVGHQKADSRRFAELRLAASGLKGTGLLEVFAVVEVQGRGEIRREVIGQTEVVLDDPNPNFTTGFSICCDKLTQMETTIIVTFYDRCHRHWALSRSPIPMGKVEFMLSKILNSREKCLDIPLSLSSSRAEPEGLVFISLEEFRIRSSIRDLVSVRLSLDEKVDLAPNLAFFFAISRELKSSPGQWNRIYRSPLLGTPGHVHHHHMDHAKEILTSCTATICSRNLFAKDVDRRMLIELYRVDLSSHRGVENPPVLSGCVFTTVRALHNCQVLNRPLHMECQPSSNLAAAKLVYDRGSTMSGEEGERKAMILTLTGVRWHKSEAEKKRAIQQNTFVEQDCWGRKERTIEGGEMAKSWVGSSISFRRTLVLAK